MPASTRTARRPRPAITVSERDHRIVSGLARSALDRLPQVAEALLDEMDRARIVPEGRRPAHVVGIGSEVDYLSETGQARTVRLVMPADADIDASRVSILTPVGAALIGLSPGQSLDWTGPAGHRHSLTVLAVRQPAP